MKYEKGSFIVIPNSHLFSTVSPGALATFVHLCGMVNEHGNCYPSRKLLAKKLGLADDSTKTVDRYLNELVVAHFITKSPRTDASGDQTSNLYQVVVQPLPQGQPTPTPQGQPTLRTIYNSLTIKDSEAPLRVESYSDEDKPQKKDRRVKEKEQVFRLFSSKREPWWFHKTQRDAALRLYDRGIDKLTLGLEIMAAKEYDYCPEASTPFEYEQKLPKLNAYKKRNGI